MNVKNVWLHGLAAGLVAGLVDGAMIKGFAPSSPPWVVAEAILFWTTAGWAVVASSSGLGRFGHGVVTSLLLSLPWYIQETVPSGQYGHLPPLVLQGVVFGLGFGLVRGRLARAVSPGAGAG